LEELPEQKLEKLIAVETTTDGAITKAYKYVNL
jgi:hypothetical protein